MSSRSRPSKTICFGRIAMRSCQEHDQGDQGHDHIFEWWIESYCLYEILISKMNVLDKCLVWLWRFTDSWTMWPMPEDSAISRKRLGLAENFFENVAEAASHLLSIIEPIVCNVRVRFPKFLVTKARVVLNHFPQLISSHAATRTYLSFIQQTCMSFKHDLPL